MTLCHAFPGASSRSAVKRRASGCPTPGPLSPATLRPCAPGDPRPGLGSITADPRELAHSHSQGLGRVTQCPRVGGPTPQVLAPDPACMFPGGGTLDGLPAAAQPERCPSLYSPTSCRLMPECAGPPGRRAAATCSGWPSPHPPGTVTGVAGRPGASRSGKGPPQPRVPQRSGSACVARGARSCLKASPAPSPRAFSRRPPAGPRPARPRTAPAAGKSCSGTE